MKNSPPLAVYARLRSQTITVASSLALALGLTTAVYGQYMPTNTITFDDIPMDKGQYLGATSSYRPTNGVPEGITLGWGNPAWSYGFIGINDFNGAAWSTGGPASGNTNGFDCVNQSKLFFSSPVIIWSMAALRTQWAAEFGLVGYLNGQVVWKFNDNKLNNVWQTVTNGVGRPIDTLEFIATDWDTRYTDITLSDATGAPPWPVDPITVFDKVGNSNYRNQTTNCPIQLTWAVDPSATTISLTNSLGEVFDAYNNTDWSTGNGSLSVLATNAGTYTLTVQSGTNLASQQLTVQGQVLPGNVGFLTFEDLDPSKPVNSLYNWNAPAGVQLIWNNWGATGNQFNNLPTVNDVFPAQWPAQVNGTISTNNLGGTNNAILQFTDASTAVPLPVMVNSFLVWIDTNNFASWGPLHIEGRLAGAVQWSFDGSEAVQWANWVTKGAGIPVDELDFQGQWYQYDNFALSTNVPAGSLKIISTAAQNGQFQFSWNSVADWANYVVFKEDGLNGGWYQSGLNAPAVAGTPSSFSDSAGSKAFYRVLRVP